MTPNYLKISTVKMPKTKCAEILTSWGELHKIIADFTEEELITLIEYERDNKRRSQILLRLHARFNRLRQERERRVLIAG